MSTIIKRNGKYLVQIRRKGFATACRTFHLKTDADEWARFMELKADRGDLPAPVKVLDQYRVRDVLERYRDEVTIKKRSCDTETYIINAFLKTSLANLTLAQITPAHFSTYREKRLRTVKPGTVNRELSIIKHAFDITGREWDIPMNENPLKTMKKMKVSNARTRRLSPDEYALLERAALQGRSPHIIYLIRFALVTAMRRGEILSLRWDQIDLDKRTLHIPVTKNGHARTIPLSSEAIILLNELISLRDPNQKTVFNLSDNAARLVWQRLVNRAGIKDLHFHDLRHEAISHFFERGLTIPEVALISGHRDYRMLFRYTHLKAEDVAAKLV